MLDITDNFEKQLFRSKLFLGKMWFKFRVRMLSRSFRDGDVFIVGYPKSGNTWLAFAIASLMNLKLNKVEKLNLINFVELVPDINQQLFYFGSVKNDSELEGRRFFLSHALYTPHFSKVIYIVRDPRDVVTSYWHYRRLVDLDFSKTLDDYVMDWLDWPCDWGEHVESWLERENVLVVKYEDMKNDMRKVLKEILDFAGLSIGSGLISYAVNESGFDNMQLAEKKYGVYDSASKLVNTINKEKFVRKGRAGGWKDELGTEAASMIYNRYKRVMASLGYL